MKRIILLTLLIVAGTMILWSQVPQAMNYKAVAKDDWGIALPNKTITLRFTILQGSETGSIVYQETHTTTTNKFGLMDVEIGKGIPNLSTFDQIDWSTGVYYIQIEMDPNGGTNFRLEDPAHQLLSVPYALFAESSNFTETDPVFTASPLSGIWNSDIFNWNTAFNWGNHANEGYLKTFTESDPIFLLHPAHGIASDNINNWNTAYGWGDHTGLYKPLTWLPSWGEIAENPFLITSPLANQLLKYNAVTERWENWLSDFLTTEVDGSVTNEIQTLSISGNTITLSDGGSVTLPSMTGLFYYADRDNDGYGDAFSPVWVPSGVEPPSHFIPDNTDCNDNYPSINPGANEIPDNLDNNCDGLIDNYQCTPFSSFPTVHSGEFSATINQFCFSLPDIPSTGQCTINVEVGTGGPWVYIDAYADNIMLASDDNVLVFKVEQGVEYKVILRNTAHLDVLSFGPYTVTVSFETIDIDNDGYSVTEGDCNDNDASIYPGAPEICGDAIDQDCDGEVDEGCTVNDSDGDGVPDLSDNCPNVANPDQLDSDNDGMGDVCETGILALSPGISFDLTSDNSIYDENSEVLIVDAFETTIDQVVTFKSLNKKVIAIVSVGVWESWRSDASQFPADLLGNNKDSWVDERWLDINNHELLLPLIANRLSMIQGKGFDGVAVDDINAYEQVSGFNITTQNEIDYCRLIITAAHSLGLSIGQVNALGLIQELSDEMNWLVVESSFGYAESQSCSPYILNNKAVLAIEYSDHFTSADFISDVCPLASALNISAILKNVERTELIASCQTNGSSTDSDGDGYTTSQGDCNDNDAAVYPGATEVCGDGIDSDCDGKDPKCPENLIIDSSFEHTSMNEWNASGVTYTGFFAFDGYSSAMFAQTYCTISQDVTIPAGASSLKINFWELNEYFVSSPTNYLAIYIDGQSLCRINPAAHNTWLSFSYDIPLSFSDGGIHTLSIESSNDPSITPYYVDKVELIISY